MKHLIVIVAATCVLALGTMSAGAAVAGHEPDTQARQAVWMRIKFPTGSTHMAVTYDKSLVAAAAGAFDGSSETQGWGFRPIIQKDGTVKVKVYRLHFTKKDGSLKPGKHPHYLETLAPHPLATTTLPTDRHIQIKIMGTGSAKKLIMQLRELEHVAQWQP
ncbi:MAG: hypothetical protein ACRETC_07485 [Gammaproteobacteria bacterium]